MTRKSRFIHQVMSGDPASIAREIDDLGDQALTYSQVMAIATGNPLIMEKATVEADLTKLRRLRSAHDAEQALLRRRIDGWTREVDHLREQLTHLRFAEAVRLPTRGDQFAVRLPDGKTTCSRVEWGALLCKALVENTLASGSASQTIDVGTLGGLGITVQQSDCGRSSDQITIDATGQSILLPHEDALFSDPVGLVRRVEHLLERVPTAIVERTERIERVRTDLAAAASRIGSPYPKEVELEHLQRRMNFIQATLVPPADLADRREVIERKSGRLARVSQSSVPFVPTH